MSKHTSNLKDKKMTDEEQRAAILSTFKKIAIAYYTKWGLPYSEDSLDIINCDVDQGFKKVRTQLPKLAEHLMNDYETLTDDPKELDRLHWLRHNILLHLGHINRVYKCPLLNNSPILVSGDYNHRPSYIVRTAPYEGCHLVRLDITAMDQHIQSKGLTDKSIAEIGYVCKYDVQDRLRLFSTFGNTWVFIDDHFNERYVLLEEI